MKSIRVNKKMFSSLLLPNCKDLPWINYHFHHVLKSDSRLPFLEQLRKY